MTGDVLIMVRSLTVKRVLVCLPSHWRRTVEFAPVRELPHTTVKIRSSAYFHVSFRRIWAKLLRFELGLPVPLLRASTTLDLATGSWLVTDSNY